MNILILCQYYHPEPFRISDICEALVKSGHTVTVITGEPNYPEGKIYKGYEHHKRADEVINGVVIHRCPIIPRKTGFFYRILNYFSFPVSAKSYIKKLKTSFDIVFVNQLSPIMMAEPAIYYKKKTGIPVLLYCLDLWPESLCTGGVRKESLIYKFFYIISKKVYTKMDRILITSRAFRNYLEDEFNVDAQKIEYLPQYAEELFDNMPYNEQGDTVNLLFAGNIGVAQSVNTILDAAEELKSDNVCFQIVGAGIELDNLVKKANDKELNNITFYGRLPIDKMPELYAKADAMIVTLKNDGVLNRTLPGKVQSYMAAGKPIIGAANGETALIIKESDCGYCGNAEDSNTLACNIRKFINSKEKKKMGENALKYYKEHFDREIFMDKLEKELETLSRKGD